jgi:hypothetical protein
LGKGRKKREMRIERRDCFAERGMKKAQEVSLKPVHKSINQTNLEAL